MKNNSVFDWNVSETDYRAYPALNFHTLANFHRDPRAFKDGFFDVKEETPAMAFGTALHSRILEPELFKNVYATFNAPVNPRTGETYGVNTNAYKDARDKWLQENAGKRIISEADVETIERIVDSYRFHAHASKILRDPVVVEQPLRAIVQIAPDSPETIEVKGKIDALTAEGLVDLKTTANFDDTSGRERFKYTVYDYKYIVQLAFYRMILREIGYSGCLRCWIIAFEKNEPHRVAVYVFQDSVIDSAESVARSWLLQWKYAHDNDRFKSRFDEIQVISDYKAERDL